MSIFGWIIVVALCWWATGIITVIWGVYDDLRNDTPYTITDLIVISIVSLFGVIIAYTTLKEKFGGRITEFCNNTVVFGKKEQEK
jgi:hypothetical protein